MKKKQYTGQDAAAEMKIFDAKEMEEGYDTYMEYVYDNFFDLSGMVKKPKVGKTVLEVGCGSGAFGRRLAKRGYKVTGIDLSNTLVKKANALAKKEKTVYKAVAGDVFNYKGKGYDTVMCVGFLHHFEDLSPIVNKLGDFLGKNGEIIIMEPNGSNPAIKFTEMIRKNIWPFNTMATLGTANETNHTVGKYAAEFKSAGFEMTFCSGFIAKTKFGDYGPGMNFLLGIKYFFEYAFAGLMTPSIAGTVIVMKFKK